MFNEQMNCIQKHPDFISPLLRPLSHEPSRNKGLTEISLQMQKGIWKILVKTVTIFLLVSDFYCSFLMFSELSNAALLFVQLTILVLSLTFSSLFLGEQKNLFKRPKGLKEEIKARLFLATIPPAENTAALEMRKQLIALLDTMSVLQL